jgi:hypothetical protein
LQEPVIVTWWTFPTRGSQEPVIGTWWTFPTRGSQEPVIVTWWTFPTRGSQEPVIVTWWTFPTRGSQEPVIAYQNLNLTYNFFSKMSAHFFSCHLMKFLLNSNDSDLGWTMEGRSVTHNFESAHGQVKITFN